MIVYSMQGEYLSECTYLIVEGNKAIVIDPGATAQRISAECEKLGVTILAVLLTHGHADHAIGAPGLQEMGYKIYAHKEEFSLIAGRASLSLALGLPHLSYIPDVAVEDGTVLELAPFTIRVIHTPGHTQGGVSYLIGDELFTGDTLFPGSYGRTDFPTGDEQDLVNSICNELFELPKETRVYSGHGDATREATLAMPQTTIGEEYSTNPILYLL